MKIIIAFLIVIYWLITAIVGLSFVGLLLFMVADDVWFKWGSTLMEMLKE